MREVDNFDEPAVHLDGFADSGLAVHARSGSLPGSPGCRQVGRPHVAQCSSDNLSRSVDALPYRRSMSSLCLLPSETALRILFFSRGSPGESKWWRSSRRDDFTKAVERLLPGAPVASGPVAHGADCTGRTRPTRYVT